MGRNALWIALWGLGGFSLGTATLVGPVAWITGHARENGWPPTREDWVVRGIILALVVVTGLASHWLADVALRSPFRHVRLGLPSLVALCAAATVWLWLNPAVMGSTGLVAEVSAGFTIGPYPDADRLAQLEREGYDGVVSLLHPAVVPFETKLIAEGRTAAEAAGLEFVHVPMLPWVSDNAKAIATLEQLARSGSGRYYVHCYLGKDRARIARNIIEQAAPDVVVAADAALRAHEERRRLRTGTVMERGEVVVLDEDVFLTPYPTIDEFMSYFVGGAHGPVVSLLDPQNAADRVWIEKERELLAGNQVELTVLPLTIQPFDPYSVLAAARQVAAMERPVLVHHFLGIDSGRAPVMEAFLQAFRSDLPPLPPALFAEPLARGRVVLAAPNVALGPEPKSREFALLRDRGVREFVFLGDADSEAAVDGRRAAEEEQLTFRVAPADSAEVDRLIRDGGPWYLYGPGLRARQPDWIATLGPAMPEGMQAGNDEAIAPAGDAEGTDEIAAGGEPDPTLLSAVRERLFLPGPRPVILLTPVFLLIAGAAAALGGWLRIEKRVAAPYTRKLFHFAIFTLAGVVHLTVGPEGVMVFGGIVASLVLYAVWRGAGFPFYEAMARPTDAPRRSMFILVPMVTTALGGLVSTALFGPFAFVGFLVTGWGDAVAEPIGTAWGRHRYSVPSIGGIPASRSLEGSAGVLFIGGLAAGLGLIATGVAVPLALTIGLACGLAGSLLEAVSHHGLDNLTVQLAASGTAWLLLF